MSVHALPTTITDSKIPAGEAWSCEAEGCGVTGTLRQRSGVPFYSHYHNVNCGNWRPGDSERSYVFCIRHALGYQESHFKVQRPL